MKLRVKSMDSFKPSTGRESSLCICGSFPVLLYFFIFAYTNRPDVSSLWGKMYNSGFSFCLLRWNICGYLFNCNWTRIRFRIHSGKDLTPIILSADARFLRLSSFVQAFGARIISNSISCFARQQLLCHLFQRFF